MATAEAPSAPPMEITEEGRTALQLDPAMALTLARAIRLSREEHNHKDAADSLGDLLKEPCVVLRAPHALLCSQLAAALTTHPLTFPPTHSRILRWRSAAPCATASWPL